MCVWCVCVVCVVFVVWVVHTRTQRVFGIVGELAYLPYKPELGLTHELSAATALLIGAHSLRAQPACPAFLTRSKLLAC